MAKQVEKDEAKKILDIINEGLGEAKLICSSGMRENDKVNLVFEWNNKLVVCRFCPFHGEILEDEPMLWVEKDEVAYYM